MPPFMTKILIHLGVFIVEHFGVPWLEQQFPKLAPLLDEILALIKAQGKALPSDALRDCAHGFCATVGVPTPIQK